MKAQAKAIVASLVVIALALTAVSGVTYSWFSDTENSDIDISTAKIDIKGEFTESSVTGAGAGTGAEGENHTVATPTGNNLKIQNLIAATQVSSTYSVTNESKVSTIYRMYVSIDSDNLPEFMSIKITADNSVLYANEQSLTFTDGIAYIVGGKESGKPLEVEIESLEFTIDIITEGSFSTPFNSTIKVICEAYQSDYTYTEPMVISNAGTAIMPASPTDDITFKGTAPASGSSASPADVEVIFSKDAASAATNGSSNVVLKTEMVDTTSGIAKIRLTLENGNTNFNGKYVTISVMVPGEHDGIEVVYTDGSAEQPILIGCSYDSVANMTKVTFKTSHFSEFEIKVIGKEYITISDSESLRSALTNPAGGSFNYILKDGLYITNFTIPENKEITVLGNNEKTVLTGQIAYFTSGILSLNNLSYNVDESITAQGLNSDGSAVSQTSASAIALWGDVEFFADNVTFNSILADSTVITAWWSTGDGANITVENCKFNCNGQRPIRSDASVTVQNCIFNDPYRYAVQVTSKTNTITSEGNAVINFIDNTIIAGTTVADKPVYGVQLCSDANNSYRCANLTINGEGNIIDLNETGKTSSMYYCDCGLNDHTTIVWNTSESITHEETGVTG